MIRLIQIALLLAIIIPLGMVRAQEQNAQTALIQAKGEWEWCVETAHSLLPVPQATDLWTRSEAAFDKCKTEEELFLAAIDLGAPSETARRQARFLHYKNKVATKARLVNSEFKAMTDAMGKK